MNLQEQNDIRSDVLAIYNSLTHDLEGWIQQLQSDLLRIASYENLPQPRKVPMGGLKGLWRRLIHGNTPENPNWWYGHHEVPQASKQTPASSLFKLPVEHRVTLKQYNLLDEYISNQLDVLLSECLICEAVTLPSAMTQAIDRFRTNVARTLKRHVLSLYHTMNLPNIPRDLAQSISKIAATGDTQATGHVPEPSDAVTVTKHEPAHMPGTGPTAPSKKRSAATQAQPASTIQPTTAMPATPATPDVSTNLQPNVQPGTQTDVSTDTQTPDVQTPEPSIGGPDAAPVEAEKKHVPEKPIKKQENWSLLKRTSPGSKQYTILPVSSVSGKMQHIQQLTKILQDVAKRGVDVLDRNKALETINQLFIESHPDSDKNAQYVVLDPSIVNLFEEIVKNKYDYSSRKAASDALGYQDGKVNGKVFAGPWAITQGRGSIGGSGEGPDHCVAVWQYHRSQAATKDSSLAQAWLDICKVMSQNGHNPYDTRDTSHFLKTQMNVSLPIEFYDKHPLSAVLAHLYHSGHKTGVKDSVSRKVEKDPLAEELAGLKKQLPGYKGIHHILHPIKHGEHEFRIQNNKNVAKFPVYKELVAMMQAYIDTHPDDTEHNEINIKNVQRVLKKLVGQEVHWPSDYVNHFKQEIDRLSQPENIDQDLYKYYKNLWANRYEIRGDVEDKPYSPQIRPKTQRKAVEPKAAVEKSEKSLEPPEKAPTQVEKPLESPSTAVAAVSPPPEKSPSIEKSPQPADELEAPPSSSDDDASGEFSLGDLIGSENVPGETAPTSGEQAPDSSTSEAPDEAVEDEDEDEEEKRIRDMTGKKHQTTTAADATTDATAFDDFGA